MKRLVGGLGALGVLGAIWGVLVIVGLALGAFPPIERGAGGAHAGAGTHAGTDAGVEADASVATVPAEAVGGSVAVAAEGPETPDAAEAAATHVGELAAPLPTADTSDAVARTIVCDAGTRRPGLALVQLVGDPRPEIAVLCGRTVDVLAVEASGADGALRVMRVATFDLTADGTEPQAGLAARAVAAGDVDGDGAPDLVLGFADPADHARGGALFLVTRDTTGAFARPRTLAPIVAIAATVRALDARPGAEIIALHRAQVASRRGSEVWVFGGGAAPSRVALQRVGIGAEALAVADLDRDGNDDVLVTSSDGPRVDVLFGDGATGFPRNRQLAVQGAREAVAGDIDGDGAIDVVLGGDATLLVRAVESPEAIEARPIEAANGLRLLAMGDTDANGARELVGYMHPELVAFSGLAGPTPTRRTLRILHAGDPMPIALAVGDLDADGHAELVALARLGDDAPFELVIVPAGTAPFASIAEPLRDAPLTLHVTLR